MTDLHQRCENCFYWRMSDVRLDKSLYGQECHRRSPGVDLWPQGRWPTTHATSWCGEWKATEAWFVAALAANQNGETVPTGPREQP